MMTDEEKYRDLLNHTSALAEDELGKFITKSQHAKMPEGKGKEKIWQGIEKNLKDENDQILSKKWIYTGIAATVALIVTLTLLMQPEPAYHHYSTGIAETIVHELPDGSLATLNANTTLRYSNTWNRTLELSGEAFFEVEKGEKFTVTTSLGEVEVLGTSFNVFARNGDLEVACKTGKVKVTVPSKLFEESINPGELIALHSDTVKKDLRKPELMGRWKSGEFYFNNQPISKVMAELKRQFKVQLEYEGREIEFSGYFTNKNLDQALDMVCLPLGLTYERVSTSRIVISDSKR